LGSGNAEVTDGRRTPNSVVLVRMSFRRPEAGERVVRQTGTPRRNAQTGKIALAERLLQPIVDDLRAPVVVPEMAND